MSAPKGNKFASHDKPWTNALQRVLAQLELSDESGKQTVKAGEALRQIAEVTVIRALGGDKDARKEIAERLDGKPTEFLNINHSNDPSNLSDGELADIATRSGEGVAEEAGGAKEPSQLH